MSTALKVSVLLLDWHFRASAHKIKAVLIRSSCSNIDVNFALGLVFANCGISVLNISLGFTVPETCHILGRGEIDSECKRMNLKK